MSEDFYLFYPLQWDSDGDDNAAATNNEERSGLPTNENSDTDFNEDSPFVHHRRPNRDLWWWWALVAGCAGVVIAAAVLQYRNQDAGVIIMDEDFLNDPANCPAQPAAAARKALASTADPIDLVDVLQDHTKCLLVGIILGTVVLRLFEWRPEGTVELVAAAQVAIPLCAAAAMFATESYGSAAVLLVLGIINLVCVRIWRAKLPVLGRLISIACSVISDNPNLVWASVLIQAALTVGMTACNYAVSVTTDIRVLQPAPLTHDPDPDSGICLHMLTQQPTACCQWNTPAWVVLAFYPSLILKLWVIAISIQAQAYVIAGVVCQWYFAPASATSFRSNTQRSGKHMASSLGTLALGSLALYFVRALRTFSYINDRRLTWKNPLAYICGILFCPLFCLSCCTNPCFDGITKYATHRAAISGYSFRDSNTIMRHTLRRQQLNHIGMGWVPPFILIFSRATLATIVGVLSASRGSLGVEGEARFGGSTRALASAYFANGTMSTINLGLFLAGPLLLGIIDSLYVCFALDLEQQTCTKKAVHDIFCRGSTPRIGPIWDDVPRADSAYAVIPGAPVVQQGGDSAGRMPEDALAPAVRAPANPTSTNTN